MAIQVVKNSTKQPDKKGKNDLFDNLSKTQRIDGKIVITKTAAEKKEISLAATQKISPNQKLSASQKISIKNGSAEPEKKSQLTDGKIVITKSAPEKTPGKDGSANSKNSSARKKKKFSNELQPAGGGKKLAIAAAVMGAGLMIIVLVKVNNANAYSARKTAPARQQTSQRHAPAPVPYEPKRYDELGGLTMAEWEKIHNTNNALLEARKKHRSFR